ncbi:bifunctional hydroxymethylpyrimidine kinase/phosphomethylpyrimidine kinase [Taylorella asinigenitalis]|uniref:bifunctional hydroxymethylpyrimidine kinase/phosphomethylpyrimidine kinase n=1 Tax=Taylorella asinigenitalis TaxID=84590 RepID=UPI00048C925C|nr:bifunctional hydroxymethylpyrimidine kinase/phosphomethylpyrimidine kinase [Taylorella asinigenitalis]
MIKNTLTIAGVDPSGGAGVLADIKVMSALGTYACGIIAALTAQNTQRVTGVKPIDKEFIKLQIDTLFEDVRIDGVKIGMLGDAVTIRTVADGLEKHKPPFIVLDTVMVAKSGDKLLEDSAIKSLREDLIPFAQMITPNLPEASELLESMSIATIQEAYKATERLHKLMNQSRESWVLLKGGHSSGSETVDLLFNGDKMIEHVNAKHETKNTHGTGCSLSSAICALQTKYEDVPKATRIAIDYVHEAIENAGLLTVGNGHGPIHHFYNVW